MEGRQLFAIIDGALETDLQLMLERYNPPYCCLYAEPVQPELLELAPWLVMVDQEIEAWLGTRETPWGIYIYSKANIKSLRQHLRKYLHVLIPDQEKPVYFRFYDPRNIWDFLQVLSDWDIHTFLGPIEKIRTSFESVERENDFSAIREPFPKDAKSGRKMLKISEVQYEEINTSAKKRYINVLASDIESYWLSVQENVVEEEDEDDILTRIYKGTYFNTKDEVPVITIQEDTAADYKKDASSFAKECFYFCKENAINDDHSIRAIVHLLLKKNIFTIDMIPDAWRSQLTESQIPGYYRVESLMLRELGEIPDVAHLIKGR